MDILSKAKKEGELLRKIFLKTFCFWCDKGTLDTVSWFSTWNHIYFDILLCSNYRWGHFCILTCLIHIFAHNLLLYEYFWAHRPAQSLQCRTQEMFGLQFSKVKMDIPCRWDDFSAFAVSKWMFPLCLSLNPTKHFLVYVAVELFLFAECKSH